MELITNTTVAGTKACRAAGLVSAGHMTFHRAEGSPSVAAALWSSDAAGTVIDVAIGAQATRLNDGQPFDRLGAALVAARRFVEAALAE